MEEELIAAIATGGVGSAIGVIRLSGPGAARCAGVVFAPRDGKPLGQHPPRTLVYGTLQDREGREIDRILATWSPAGGSYTGEETAELQCHGSPTVLALAMEALFAQGARQAKPGEFTRRAFLNGKLDLAQAEAVMDLIDAGTPAAARQAAGQLAGALSRRTEEIYSGLLDVLAHFHAVLDYPDENLDPFTVQTVADALSQAEGQLKALLDSYSRGRAVREGLPCAIVGRPNAGKSTLLNALVGYERAIVTDVPGTTRDTVEETCILGGLLLRLMDTAGIRNTADPLEQLGVERSSRAMEAAELILVVVDGSQPMGGEELALLHRAQALAPTILVYNKQDLPCPPISVMEGDGPAVAKVSAKTGRGLDQLAGAVEQLFPRGRENGGEVLTNARQAQAAGQALEAVERARRALGAGVTPDALLTDVEEALSALGELTGRSIREDVVDRIFSRFCVGK